MEYSALNGRSASSSSSLSSSWFGESERTQGAYSSRLHNQQQDSDSKRPKLSYTSTSGVRSNGLNTDSDSPWRYSSVPRSSTMVLGSLGTELVRERRELERADPSIGSLVDYSRRSGDFPSSSYLQERSAASYAQGARPKDNSLSSLRLNTSMNRQLPSEHQSSLLSRDHSWSSRSNYVPREVESSERNIQPEFTHGAMRSGASSSSGSERITQSQRSLSEPPGDTEGRRTTRQLLSRLASSMSSTFFSRRSSQDSLTSRQLGPEDSPVSRALSSTQASAANTAEEGGEKEEMKLQEPLPLKHRLDHCIFLGEENQVAKQLLKHKVIPSGLLRGHQHPQYRTVLHLPHRRIQDTVEEIQEYIIPSGWNQSDGQDNDKSKVPPSRDPERLQKIKESLLSEDSEEEEGDLCRICQMSSTSPTNPLIEPCKCTGSLRYVHQECMKKWLQSKINSGSSLEAVTTCELCKEKLHLNLDDFDIHELHRAHANEQADYEFISSGLYLVVLLHLCEQRFSDMLGTTSEANTRVRLETLAACVLELSCPRSL
ncbi:UNVERIFIED_CONTAM: hypothetical protein K2H54_037955 [Gekko kuhli]